MEAFAILSVAREYDLLDKGFVSFGVTDAISDWRDEVSDPKTRLSEQQKDSIERNLTDITRLTIDNASVLGSASADIPREQDAFWHVVTETVFYHSKMHLTEKIFKPIVNKQPFMLLAAPDNLAYLKSYGFKTFDSVIDEDYDICQDNQERINKVVSQLHWYANLSPSDKTDVQEHLKPIIEQQAITYGVCHVFEEEIDQINILNASITAMQRSIEKLSPKAELLAPVVLASKAAKPRATFSSPVVLAVIALLPTAVLLLAVVLAAKAA